MCIQFFNFLYGKAALVGEVIKSLPQVAAEIVAPLRNTEKITLVSSGDGQIGVQRVVGEIYLWDISRFITNQFWMQNQCFLGMFTTHG